MPPRYTGPIVSLANGGKPSSATLTRAATTTAYAAGDVVSDSESAPHVLSFPSLGASGDMIAILGARLRIDVDAVPSGMAGFRLHLYNAAPTAIADNVAYNLPAGDRAKYLGYITLSTPLDLGATLWGQDDNVNFTALLAGTGLYGILETIGAYTPAASTVFTIGLNAAGV